MDRLGKPEIRRSLARPVAVAALWLLLPLLVSTLAGCKQADDCKRHCRRVALCKREARGGKLILGEKPPPADVDCMHKCHDRPDAFAKCEASKRTCEAMRDCYGSYRD